MPGVRGLRTATIGMGDMSTFQCLHCPYCGEAIDLPIDASAGDQRCIEDCPVCCRPIELQVAVDDGRIEVVARAQDDV